MDHAGSLPRRSTSAKPHGVCCCPCSVDAGGRVWTNPCQPRLTILTCLLNGRGSHFCFGKGVIARLVLHIARMIANVFCLVESYRAGPRILVVSCRLQLGCGIPSASDIDVNSDIEAMRLGLLLVITPSKILDMPWSSIRLIIAPLPCTQTHKYCRKPLGIRNRLDRPLTT